MVLISLIVLESTPPSAVFRVGGTVGLGSSQQTHADTNHRGPGLGNSMSLGN